jgi:hypothetical protein
MSVEAFPLQWPDGWPRNPYRGGSRFDTSFDKARIKLLNELRMLGADNIVISSNLPLRQDGYPYSDKYKVDDPGVALYFRLKKRPMVMARDDYSYVRDNLCALWHAIAHLRGLERHGGATMMERAFAGFVAIAPPDWKKPWREVFGVKPEWSGDITALYREKARRRHPDAGGSDTLMAELNLAFAEAKKEIRT